MDGAERGTSGEDIPLANGRWVRLRYLRLPCPRRPIVLALPLPVTLVACRLPAPTSSEDTAGTEVWSAWTVSAASAARPLISARQVQRLVGTPRDWEQGIHLPDNTTTAFSA